MSTMKPGITAGGSALECAVVSMCKVVEAACYTPGYWLVDSTSGVTPQRLNEYSRTDVIIKHPGTAVHLERGLIDGEMLTNAVYSLRLFIEGSMSGIEEPTE